MADSPWTPERDAQLRADWAAGYSGTEIGRRMGITKSAAIGRAHRLKLPPRVSPIATLNRPWTEEEDSTLRQVYGGLLNARQIGEKFQRSESSIRCRAAHLGLVSKKGSATHRARLSDARRLTLPQKSRVTKVPCAAGYSAPSSQNSPGDDARDALQSRRVFLGMECKAPLGERGAIRFCAEPVIENAKGCASPYCIEHYALFYIGTNASLGNPGPLRWR